MKILNKLFAQSIELIRILLVCLPGVVIVGCAFMSPFQNSRTISMSAIVASPTLGVVVDEKLMIVDLRSERIGEQMGLQKGDILISLNGALFDVKDQSKIREILNTEPDLILLVEREGKTLEFKTTTWVDNPPDDVVSITVDSSMSQAEIDAAADAELRKRGIMPPPDYTPPPTPTAIPENAGLYYY